MEESVRSPGPVPSLEIGVSHASDVYTVASAVREHLLGQAYPPELALRAATVAAELASNVIFHGGGRGRVGLGREGASVVVWAEDRGPGMADPARLFDDDYGGDRGGLGLGGGTIRRFSRGCVATARPGGGLFVLARLERGP